MNELEKLKEAVVAGKHLDAEAVVQSALDAGTEPAELLNSAMIPAMREIGERFGRGEIYMPQLLVAARAMKAGLKLIEPRLSVAERDRRLRVAIGTVKGDLHDIGKNLVAVMLRGAGYEVVDLGVNCDLAQFERAVDDGAQLIGCSSLLTTTMPYMAEVVASIHRRGIPVIVGGAPVSQEFAEKIGADGYSRDAAAAVRLVDTRLGEKQTP